MIQTVAYTSTGTSIVITMADGSVWRDDASLPPDTDLRRQLADWLAAGGEISAYIEPVPPLEALRATAKAGVDAAAEAYRLTYITGGSGQAMAYQQKLEEAKAYLADPSLTAAEWPAALM